MFLDYIAQVMGMLKANIFNTEVIDNESEHEKLPFVAPKARCGIKLAIPAALS